MALTAYSILHKNFDLSYFSDIFPTIHLQKGLRKEEHRTSSVKCFPTYVRSLPNGEEHGKFLSLDLGGTNFRVIVMELMPNQEFLMDNKIYSIPHEVMTGV
jgi:hexokinase